MALIVEHDRHPDDPRGPLTLALRGVDVSIIGYGNQGRAHALNLRDSGVSVLIGARSDSASGDLARREEFTVLSIAEASSRGGLVIVALPDEMHGEVALRDILPALGPGATLGFIHGFSIRFGLVKPSPGAGVVLVAPKGPGSALRHRYLEGLGIPSLLAVSQESCAGDAEARALAWASGLGCGRAGIVRTSFADEAETDLFGEQAVLCGGAMALAEAAFATLIEAGYPPELAYVECVHELRQVVDLLFERGFAGMRRAISNTAEFGGYRAGERIVDESLRARLRELLGEIRDGSFARAFADDQRRGWPWFNSQRQSESRRAIDQAGAAVRAWMPWMTSTPPSSPHPH